MLPFFYFDKKEVVTLADELKLLKGLESSLPTTNIQTGAIYYCTDTHNAFLGKSSTTLEFFLSGVGRRFRHTDGSLKGEIFNDYTNNKAAGTYAFAAGGSTTASGNYATALNYGTLASNAYSTALGQGTKSTADASLVIGKYNALDSSKTFIFAIGYGTSDTARKNIFTVDSAGNVVVASGITASSANLTSLTLKEFYLVNSSNVQTASFLVASSKPTLTIGTSGTNGIAGALVVNGTTSVSGKASLGSLEVSGETTLVGTTKIKGTSTYAATLVGPSSNQTFTFGNGGLFVTKSSTDAAVGGASTPVYVDGGGTITACSKYGGGTAVTLNSTGKGAGDASFYAPTESGSSGQVLQSAGSGKAPTWITATNSNTGSTIVKRDANGDFSAGTITATLSGNASTASKWATARTITLSGDTTGSVSLDGSKDVTLTITVSNNSHTHTWSNISDNGSCTINTSGTITGSKVYGAVWNDYAEYRAQKESIEAGYCVTSDDKGRVSKTIRKYQACDGIVSDTFGFAIGETENCKTPLAVSGRVLAYCEGDRNDYHAGDTVCAGPNGKVMKMTREEIRVWPDRVIGIVSEIPEYETWGSGNIKVNGRIWIKVK